MSEHNTEYSDLQLLISTYQIYSTGRRVITCYGLIKTTPYHCVSCGCF